MKEDNKEEEKEEVNESNVFCDKGHSMKLK